MSEAQKVIPLRSRVTLDVVSSTETERIVTTDGGGGGGDDMLEKLEKRVDKLEGDIGTMKTDIALLRQAVDKNLSTKDDLHTQTTRFIGWMLSIFALFVALNAGISVLLRFVGKP